MTSKSELKRTLTMMSPLDAANHVYNIEQKLMLLDEAVSKVLRQDRVRGYPTGHEWHELVRTCKLASEKLTL